MRERGGGARMTSSRSVGNIRGKSIFGGLRSETSRDRLIFNDVVPSAEHAENAMENEDLSARQFAPLRYFYTLE